MHNYDRFIPSRSAMTEFCSADAFKNVQKPENSYQHSLYDIIFEGSSYENPTLATRKLSKISPLPAEPKWFVPENHFLILDTPNVDFNAIRDPVAWSSQNQIAVALGDQCYLKKIRKFQNTRTNLLNNQGVQGNIQALSWSADGGKIAVGVPGGIVSIWDIRARNVERVLQTTFITKINQIQACALPIIKAAHSHDYVTYDLRAPQTLQVTNTHIPDPITCVSEHQNGQDVIIATTGGKIYGLDNRRSGLVFDVNFSNEAIVALKWNPDGERSIAFGTESGEVSVYGAITTGNPILRARCLTGEPLQELLWTEKDTIITGHSSEEIKKKMIKVWRASTLESVDNLMKKFSTSLGSMSISPNGDYLSYVSRYEALYIFDAPKKEQLPEIANQRSPNSIADQNSRGVIR